MERNMKKIYFLSILVATMCLLSAGKRPVTLFMCGDSTMADKTELDISPERGWGQLFPSYLKGNIVVQNHAMNGRSTKSFIDEGRWQVVLDRMHKGDWVILQFGHNDSKISDPKRYASIEDYENNLIRMVEEAQDKGAFVMIATPISRRYFKDGVWYPRHGGYPEAARRVAAAMRVPCLDLEAATADWLKELGDEASKAYYMNVAPGECTKFPEGKIDNTHLRENGAMAVGAMAVKEMLLLNSRRVLPYLRTDDDIQPVYTVFCRPSFDSDKKVKQESDMKSFKE